MGLHGAEDAAGLLPAPPGAVGGAVAGGLRDGEGAHVGGGRGGEGFRPGVVSMVQTFGDRANFHPHVHALASRGGWTSSGEWIPVPYVDERAAEELFRHKVLALLRRRGLLSEERIDLLLSWRRSGFSVHNRVYAHPGDGREFEGLVRYMSRSPVSLKRLRFAPGSKEVVYTRKGRHDTSEPAEDERIDAEEFVARVLVQIPDPRRHLVRYYAAGSVMES